MKNISIWIIILHISFCLGIYARDNVITFHYLGHSSFIIIFDNGISVLTDYGKPNAYLEYGWDSPIYDIGDFTPTICTYSHSHADHYDSTRMSANNCLILKKADTLHLKGLTIYPILTSEDDLSDKNNISFLMVYKGIQILHLGDCQANIFNIDSSENKNYIRNNIPVNADIVLMPIEGKTKFLPHLEPFIRLIHPKIIIPMHYWSDEYKQQFFALTQSENSDQHIKYKLIKTAGSKYFFYPNTEPSEFIQVINMSPSPFNQQ